jgi:hypothetical protein
MRSLLIINARPFAQSRLALRAISDNYKHVGKYTDKGKTGRKMVSHFFQDRPGWMPIIIRVTAPYGYESRSNKHYLWDGLDYFMLSVVKYA